MAGLGVYIPRVPCGHPTGLTGGICSACRWPSGPPSLTQAPDNTIDCDKECVGTADQPCQSMDCGRRWRANYGGMEIR